MTAKASTRKPRDLAVGDVVTSGHHEGRIVRLTNSVATVKLRGLVVELPRRELRKQGWATSKGKTFMLEGGSS